MGNRAEGEAAVRALWGVRSLLGLGECFTTATFFLLAEREQCHPDLVGRIRSGGHEIALQGWDHRRVSGLSRLEAGTYLRRAREALEPYGSQSLSSVRGAGDAGLDVETTFDRADMIARKVRGLRESGLEPMSLRDLAPDAMREQTL